MPEYTLAEIEGCNTIMRRNHPFERWVPIARMLGYSTPNDAWLIVNLLNTYTPEGATQ